MIHFFFLVNKLGQTRVARYYSEIQAVERRTLESELVRKCLARTPDMVNTLNKKYLYFETLCIVLITLCVYYIYRVLQYQYYMLSYYMYLLVSVYSINSPYSLFSGIVSDILIFQSFTMHHLKYKSNIFNQSYTEDTHLYTLSWESMKTNLMRLPFIFLFTNLSRFWISISKMW